MVPGTEAGDSADWLWKTKYKIAVGAAVGGLAFFALFRYHVCTPSQYLVKTGLGIPDMAIARKTMQWPWQEVRTYNMAPLNYSFHLNNNMSSEMVPFRLPVSFTIGPKDPREDLEGFKTYATKLGDLPPEKVEATIGGVIHGETRVFSAGLTIREMFEDREKFKRTVQDKIQHDMNAYGLKIYNANIAEMADQDEQTRYFQNLRQKALEGANTEMRIQRVAHSEKDLAIVRAQCERERLLAEIDVSMATDKRKAELETEVDRARTAQQIAYLQSTQDQKYWL
ncbi:hypothetical protein KFL_010370020 [Klebsormidium nitens]|uniref:Flotillin-like n=1 Tax=Klebsormidium nitens TaxID=105231 RepID=A0A1Y1IUI8_KLENI|nr:hypothetical protein KFL_010370020 [Klebsormidium nitens]|eukprot:GAQ92516.1 hypothetical protein KFL_010370020 [Klebsormidium nitens]